MNSRLTTMLSLFAGAFIFTLHASDPYDVSSPEPLKYTQEQYFKMSKGSLNAQKGKIKNKMATEQERQNNRDPIYCGAITGALVYLAAEKCGEGEHCLAAASCCGACVNAAIEPVYSWLRMRPLNNELLKVEKALLQKSD